MNKHRELNRLEDKVYYVICEKMRNALDSDIYSYGSEGMYSLTTLKVQVDHPSNWLMAHYNNPR